MYFKFQNLDATVNGAGEHGILRFRYQGLDLDDPLWHKKCWLLILWTGPHTWKWAISLFTRHPVSMSHTMISCLMPDTASLSPAERMMLLELLNFLLMFLTPLGSFSAMHLRQFVNFLHSLVYKKLCIFVPKYQLSTFKGCVAHRCTIKVISPTGGCFKVIEIQKSESLLTFPRRCSRDGTRWGL